jgi:hypothetical protein
LSNHFESITFITDVTALEHESRRFWNTICGTTLPYVACVTELAADNLVVSLSRVLRRLVELHVAEHEEGLDHLLRWQPSINHHLENAIECGLEVGVPAPAHVGIIWAGPIDFPN